MFQAIISCFEAEVNVKSDHSDCILFDECRIFNCNLWPKPTSNIEAHIVQLNPIKKVFDRYSDM